MTPFAHASERDDAVVSVLRALLASSGGQWEGSVEELTALLATFTAQRPHVRLQCPLTPTALVRDVLPRSRPAIRRAEIAVHHRRRHTAGEGVEIHRRVARARVHPNQLRLFDPDEVGRDG